MKETFDKYEKFLMWVVYACLGVLMFQCAATVASSACIQDGGVLRSSFNCTGMPSIPKYFDPAIFTWKGRQILAVSDGNELVYWNITTSNPIPIAGSVFNVPNQGDSDYDMMGYSICDDCRFGVGVWKLGIVIWDQGTGVNPGFSSKRFYPIGTDPRGAFVYSEGGKQYLVAKFLPGDMGGTATLYEVVSPTQLVPIKQISTPGTRIVGGKRIGQYVYLGMMDNWLYTFRIEGGSLTYVNRSPIRASLGRGDGFSVSGNLAVSAFVDGAKLWNVANPASPVLLYSFTGSYQYAAINGNIVWFVGSNNIPKNYFINNPSNPVQFDNEFWYLSNPWNNYGSSCVMPTGAVFSSDGKTLYFGRYAVFQKVNYTACVSAPPTPTPTPPPWPTPIPTCVPGCLFTEDYG